MRAIPDPAADRIEQVAADWIARRDGGLAAEEVRAFEGWLVADPRHANALARLETTWSTLNAPRLCGRGEALVAKANSIVARRRRQRHRRQALWLATSLAAAAALAVIFRPAAPTPAAVVPSTILALPDRQVLADGSVIELAAGAEVAVEFSPAQRGVRLVRGQALFTVAKDAAWPFVVSAGTVAVRAVGTEFAVNFSPKEISVLVTEGQVAVAPPGLADTAHSNAPDPTLVSAGNVLLVPGGSGVGAVLSLRAVDSAEIARELAWRNHRVEFSATPLAEAVELMNHGNERRLVLGDAATGNLRISGVFWTNDPAGFARLLETSLGVMARQAADGSIVLSK